MAVLKDLIVHGASRFLGGINADSIETNAIKADSGIFNQLIATTLEAKDAHIDELTANNATVFGIMDVKGKLQTNQWEAASIANIGGNFYISPTGKSSSGTVTITRTSAATSTAAAKYSVAMSGTFGVSSTSNTIWATGAYGMATGNVAVGTKKYPLGTCDGPLSNITTGTNTITGFTISNIESAALDIIFDENSSLISSNAISSKPGTDLQVSVYLGKSGSNYMPIGILLTSYGKDNKQYIDIYDGTHSAGTSITGFAEPTVRIGDLSGLSPYTQSGKYTITPQGWGIYTSQGYFRGEVYSEIGYIGGWTIDGTAIKTNNKASITDNTSGMRIDSANGIGFSGVTYFNKNGTGKIGPWTLTTTALYNGKSSYNASVSGGGVYIGTDYIAGGNGEVWWLKKDGSAKIGAMTLSSAGVLAVPAANISGTLTASQVDVSGIITAGSIVTNTLTGGTFNTTDYIRVSTQASSSLTIGTSGAKTDWRIIAGKTFGVDKSGNLYATSVNITGALTATSLTINSGATIGGDGASQILNSDIEVGGRNLVLRTGTMPAVSNGVNGFRASGGTATHIDISSPPIAGITGGIRVTNSGSSAARIGMAQDQRTNTFVTGEIYSEGFWIRASSSFTSQITIQPVWISSSQWASIDAFSVNLTTNWQYIKGEGAVLKGTQANSYSCGYVYASNVPAGGWIEICGLKLEKGNKATDWTPAPEDIEVDIYEASTKATSYITYVSATEGIKVHNSGDTTDYVQVNSSAIKMYRNNVEKMLLNDTSFRIGSIGSNKRNLYITDSAVQIRNNTIVLAEYGETTKFYDGNGVADSNIAAQIGADGLDIIKGHIGDWTIESGDIKYSAGVNETSPTISLTKQSTSNLRSIASIDASSSSETNPNSGARISVFYESYNSNTQTWQGDFAGCYIIPDKISLLSIAGRSLIEPNTISVGGSTPTSTIESVSTGGGAFIQANSAASEADVKAMSGGGTVYIFSSNNGNRGMYGTNSSNTGHSIIDVTNTNASYFRGQATSVSDLKKKKVITDYDWKIDEFINGLKPIAFRRIHEDGTLGDRIRMGFGAQDIRDLTKLLYKEELSLYQAKLIDNTKEGTERESSDYHGEEIDDKNLSWSLTYEELIAPMVLEIQRLMDRVDKLELEIKALKSQ